MQSQLLSTARLQDFINASERSVLLFSQRVRLTRGDPVYTLVKELDRAVSDAMSRGKRNFYCTSGSDFSKLAGAYFEDRKEKGWNLHFYLLDFARPLFDSGGQEEQPTGTDGRYYFYERPHVYLEGQYYEHLLEICSEVFVYIPAGSLARMRLYRLASEAGLPIVNILERARNSADTE